MKQTFAAVLCLSALVWSASAHASVFIHLGGTFEPQVISAAAYRSSLYGDLVDVYAVDGASRSLWLQEWEPLCLLWVGGFEVWTGWVDLDGVLISNPSAVAWGDSHREVFALGTDLHLWHNWRDDHLSWSGRDTLSAVPTRACARPPAQTRGVLDGRMRVATSNISSGGSALGWGGIADVGGDVFAGEAVAVRGGGNTDVHVWAIKADGSLWWTITT